MHCITHLFVIVYIRPRISQSVSQSVYGQRHYNSVVYTDINIDSANGSVSESDNGTNNNNKQSEEEDEDANKGDEEDNQEGEEEEQQERDKGGEEENKGDNEDNTNISVLMAQSKKRRRVNNPKYKVKHACNEQRETRKNEMGIVQKQYKKRKQVVQQEIAKDEGRRKWKRKKE